jgi:hypothetical protein
MSQNILQMKLTSAHLISTGLQPGVAEHREFSRFSGFQKVRQAVETADVHFRWLDTGLKPGVNERQ